MINKKYAEDTFHICHIPERKKNWKIHLKIVSKLKVSFGYNQMNLFF